MVFLGALEADKLTKQKWEQYCGTPCSLLKVCKIKVEVETEFNSFSLV